MPYAQRASYRANGRSRLCANPRSSSASISAAGNRLAPEKPLAVIDAGRTQEESVLPGLHALGDRAQAQCRSEANDAAEHPRCRSVLENGHEQAAIDFQNVEIETDDL